MNKLGFVNLHGHTTGSMLDAIVKVKDLFDRAKELGQTAVAVTDHGNMSNIYSAYKESKRTGVKLIPGNEIYFVDNLEDPKGKRRHLVLLAANAEGYKNLLRITARGFENSVNVMGKEFPRVDEAILRKYSEGLYATSACGGSIIAANLFNGEIDKASFYAELFHDIFQGRFYIELQPHTLQRATFNQRKLNTMLKDLATRLNIKMVATCDSHYLKPEDEKYHDMLLAISSKKPLSDPERHRYATYQMCKECDGQKDIEGEPCLACAGTGIDKILPCAEFYVKSEDEIFSFFEAEYGAPFAEELIKNTAYIASQCEFPNYIEPKGERFPIFTLDHIKQSADYEAFATWRAEKPARMAWKDDAAYLKYRCEIAYKEYAANFPHDKKKIYWDRLSFEIDILDKKGFSSYFLIVADYLAWARAQGYYTGIGRGSAAASLIGFFLKIHMVDPIQYGLLFERFLSLDRKQCPDIDSDVQSEGREALIEYIIKKYGRDKVCHITNFNRLTPKVVLKDVARSLEIGGDTATTFKIINEVTNKIPTKVTIDINGNLAEGNDGKIIEVGTIELAERYCPELVEFFRKYPEMRDYAIKLCGMPRAVGLHAGAVVISDIPLDEFVPLRRDNTGVIAVHMEKNQAEEVGLVKMDILGLETLDIIRHAFEDAQKLGIKLDRYDEVSHTLPEPYSLITSGKVLGLFQLEGSTLAPLCGPMKPRNIEDVAIINAIGRPGVSKDKRKDFIARRFGMQEVEYVDRSIADIAKATLGVSVYDEDLLRIAQKVCGWSLTQADRLRKLTKLKEKGADLAKKLEEEFVNDAEKLGLISRESAQNIWDVVVLDYAKYGFCIFKDQLIETVNGPIKISNLKSGDLLLSKNKNGSFSYEPCVEVWRSGEKEVVKITLDNGSHIQSTLDHRFMIGDEWKTMAEIINLGYVEKFYKERRVLEIISVEDLGIQEVYDISMSKEPNFVLDNGVVAHNCKAHAVAYGITGYITAYYKSKAPAPFLCAHLNSQLAKSTPELEEYIEQIKRDIRTNFNISIRTCDINQSGQMYTTVDAKTIVTGLNGVEGLGPKALAAITANKPYTSLCDFIYRSPSSVNKTVITALAKAGAFDSLGIARKYIVSLFEDPKLGKKFRDQINKFGDAMGDHYDGDRWSEFAMPNIDTIADEWTLREKMMCEKEVMGEFVSGTIADLYPGFFVGNQYFKTLRQLRSMPDKTLTELEGVVTNIREFTTRTGKSAGQTAASCTIETANRESIGLTIWADQYARIKDKLQNLPVPVRGIFKVGTFGADKQLNLHKIQAIYKNSDN